MKLECPDCKSQVTAKGTGAVSCPKCGFTAKVPVKKQTQPRPEPSQRAPAPSPNPGAPAMAPKSSAQQISPQPYSAPPPTNGFAIAALVTGILGFCQLFPAAIAAIVLGIIGLNQCRANNQPGESMAITGLILGAIGLAFTVLLFSSNFWFFL